MKFILNNPIVPEGEVLLLAGDIVPLVTTSLADRLFDLWSSQFRYVFWVPGNHEFYGSDWNVLPNHIRRPIRKNIFLVNNHIEKLNNVNFIFTSLWSNINPKNEIVVRKRVADFRMIKLDERPISIHDYNLRHAESLEFIHDAIQTCQGEKNIIVTHHVPTFMNYPERYKGDVVSEAFATELFSFIENTGTDAWIYGHHHSNTIDFTIGNTQLLTNQLGYVKYSENMGFKGARSLTV